MAKQFASTVASKHVGDSLDTVVTESTDVGLGSQDTMPGSQPASSVLGKDKDTAASPGAKPETKAIKNEKTEAPKTRPFPGSSPPKPPSPAPTQEVADPQEPPEDVTVMVTCMKCGLEKGMDVCIKKSKKFICRPCNTAASMLSQACEGGFDGQSFATLPPEEQQQFWRDAAGASRKSLVGQYESKLKVLKKKSVSVGSTGDFLPPSVWKQRGFDVDRIKKFSLEEDKREHPILGTTYRVHLDWSTNEESQSLQQEKQAMVSAGHGACAGGSGQGIVPKEPTAKAKAKAAARADAKNRAAAAKTWASASKVVAALSPVVANNRRAMQDHESEDTVAWDLVRNLWAEILDMLKDASGLVEAYNRNPDTCNLDTERLPALAYAKAKVQHFNTSIKDLLSKGRKRKAEDGTKAAGK